MRTPHRLVTVGLIAAGALTVAAGPAFAHIDPTPETVKPGKAATVSFGVEHGCDGSPTTNLTFRIPRGATDVEAVAKDGWQTSVSARTVVFDGGSLPTDEPDDFSITFTAPSRKTELRWKIIQTCETGTLRWIERDESSDYPAPVVLIGKKSSDGHGR